MNTTPDAILFEDRDDGIAILRLNSPATLNALTRESVALLNERLDAIAQTTSVRAVVLTGVGRGFCAGQDVGVAKTRGDGSGNGVAERMLWQERYSGMVQRLIGLPQAVIAAVNGPAAGVGMALALGADIRVVSRSAKFVIGSIRLGLLGGESGISYLLPQLIGASRAFEIMLTGRTIPAQEADLIGLAADIVDDDQCEARALEIASQIVANSPFGVAYTKRLMWDNLDASRQTALNAENANQILASMTSDYKEALAAFVEKRPASFKGA